MSPATPSVDPMTGEPLEDVPPQRSVERPPPTEVEPEVEPELETGEVQDDGADLPPESAGIVAAVFLDLAGLPGWGSDPKPDDPDTSTIVDRHAGPAGGEIRLVRGCTVLTTYADPRAAVRATLEILAEGQRSSGSVVAGAHVERGDPDDIGPDAKVARVAASLAGLTDADRLLVTAEVVEALHTPGSDLAFDEGPHADLDGARISTFVVRRR